MAAVVDASAVVEWLTRRPGSDIVERAILDGSAFAPELLDPEVLSALARHVRTGSLSPAGGNRAVAVLLGSPITRVPHPGLVADAWRRCGNLSAYDAFYVALAARLGCHLITADARLARAPGLGIAVTILPI